MASLDIEDEAARRDLTVIHLGFARDELRLVLTAGGAKELLVVLQLTPVYTASALIMLNTRSANVVNVASVLAGLPPDANVIKSEIDVLESRSLAARVIADLRLSGDPEFAPPPAGAGLLAMLNPQSWLPKEWQQVLLDTRE